jgi:hypothetical protein
MTVLNFPDTTGQPTDGSFKYEANGIVYSWDGQKWTAEGTGSANVGTLQQVTDRGNTTTNDITTAGQITANIGEFSTQCKVGDYANDNGANINPKGAITLKKTDGSDAQIQGKLNGSETFMLLGDGSMRVAGDISVGGTLPSDPNIVLYADSGNAVVQKLFISSDEGFSPRFTEDDNDLVVSTNNVERLRIAKEGNATFTGSITIDQNDGYPHVFSATGGAKQDLEITPADTLYINTSDVLFHHDSSASPSIHMKPSDGSITARKGIFSDAPTVENTGTLTVTNSTAAPSAGRVFVGLDKDGNATTKIGADGSAAFNGPVAIGGNDAAHTIDEYEEGTFTPNFEAISLTFDYINNYHQGFYTRIGDIVHIQFYLGMASYSGAAGNTLSISGLPFPAVAGSGQACALTVGQLHRWNPPTDSFNMFASVRPGANFIDLGWSIIPTGTGAATSNQMESVNCYIAIAGSYKIA